MKKLIFLVGLILIFCKGFSQVTDSFTANISDFHSVTKGQYDYINNPGNGSRTTQKGAPELPIIYRKYVLPLGALVSSVSFINGNKTLFGSNMFIHPTQPPCSINENCPDTEIPDPAIYNSNNSFPVETGIVGSTTNVFGYSVVTVGICPFQYIPIAKKLYVYNQITITIQYSVGNIEYSEKISERRHQMTKDFVRSSVQNSSGLTSSSKTANIVVTNSPITDKLYLHWKPSAYDVVVPDYIIITNEAFKDEFEDFAIYKSKRGIPTVVATVEQIYQNYPGLDNPEKIRNYLKSARDYWGDGLFVLLGGDTDVVPGRIASYFGNEKNYTDMYFCDVYKPGSPNYNWNSNGDSNFGYSNDIVELGADNFIGRAPVDNLLELQNFIAKVKSYEKLDNVSDKSYVNNMVFFGSYVGYTNNIGTVGGQLWHHDLAAQPFLSNSNLKKWLVFDDHLGNSHQPYLGDEELDKVNALTRLNEGLPNNLGKFHLVSHYDHGLFNGIGVSSRMKNNSLFREDMDNLHNGSYYQIMYATDCEDGEFAKDCFAERYVNAPNGGGVAMMANSGTVYTGGEEQDNKLFKSIYDDSTSPTSYILGAAFASARDAVYLNVSDAYRVKQLTLFGEPSMATWSKTPQNIVLNVAPSITIDNAVANIFEVGINSLPYEATVTLYKYNQATQMPEVYARQKIPAGTTTTQFTINPDTAGNLTVTATAHNYLPASANVTILMPQSHLYITSYTFTDSNGNGNGIIEQGETINITIGLTNSGNTPISSINTVLSPQNPLLATIINGTLTCPLINPGQTVQLPGFSFVASVVNLPNLQPDYIELLLNITAANSYTHLDNFYLDVKNPALNLGAKKLFDGTNPVASLQLNQNRNLFVSISNTGNMPTGILNATLTSSMTTAGVAQISTSTSTYSSIAQGEEQQNNTAFVIKLLSNTASQPFTLQLTNSLQKSWTFNFNLSEPLPSPQYVQGFHFTSTKNEITLMWNPASNILGYNIYRSSTINGTYSRVNNFLVSGSALYVDADPVLTPATDYFYKISKVTVTGNESPLDQILTDEIPTTQGYKTWTALDNLHGFPIEVNNGPYIYGYAPVTIADIDNDGQKELFSNIAVENEGHGKIFGYSSLGQELFDIDANPNTISGFAQTDIAMIPKSAIGDLDNNGHAEVVLIGRNDAINSGKLFVYKTTDGNSDGLPDPFWNDGEIDLGHRVFRNPVLYDVDGDGFLDIIVADESGRVYVFDRNKNLLPGLWPVQAGQGDYSEGQIAVADLNHDGKGEIALGVKAVAGTNGGIYIWNYDGTPFTTTPFKEFVGEQADSGIVFADIDNDLNLDLLVTTKTTTGSGKIYAFKVDGSPVYPAWNGVNTYPTAISHIAVGNLNHDSNLEIVFGTTGSLHVLNHDGTSFINPIPIISLADTAPILADVDSDPDVEILITDEGVIKAYNIDGNLCTGFPLRAQYSYPFLASPTVADIDSDGKSEIAAVTKGATTYVYKTSGDANNIEWGSCRGNTRNTGTYKEVCNNVLDLMVRDGLTDIGDEPNNVTPFMWTSPDIWIRNNDDSIYEPQNAEYSSTTPNFAYVRITNKSCVPTTGTGTDVIKLYWAKAGISFNWPDTWDGNHFFPIPNDNVRMGQPVGTMLIPALQPGQTTVIKFPFMVPNPAIYSGINASEPWHFCMLARIETENDPPVETSDLYQNVKNNNNLGWVNFSIVDAVPDAGTPKYSALVAVGNPYNEPHNFFIEIVKEDTETGKDIYKEAEVSIKMNDVLYNAWERGGKAAQRVDPTIDEKKKIVTGNHVLLENLLFNAKEMGTLSLKFNFLTEELTDKTKFVYHVIQKDAQTGKILGGETYIIRKKQRQPFIADAGGDKDVDAHQSITISAAEISEPAIYNWYDSSGNLIFIGKNLQIANAVAERYKLEVISTVDGFKDYSQMEVKINPNRLISVVPNSVNENTRIYYNLREVNSAYLMIVSYYMNGGVSNNYVLDTNSSDTAIDFSSYPSGFYKVILIANGTPSGMKIIYKQ